VKLATEKSVTLSQLPLEDFQSFDSSLDESVYAVLGVDKAVEAFQSVGSTAPAMVANQVDLWKKRLS